MQQPTSQYTAVSAELRSTKSRSSTSKHTSETIHEPATIQEACCQMEERHMVQASTDLKADAKPDEDQMEWTMIGYTHELMNNEYRM